MNLSSTFIEDLTALVVAERLPLPLLALAPTDDRLADLGKRLDALRDSAERLVRPLLERLEPSDPLRTPIGLMDSTGQQTDEVAHTNTIAWLLSPRNRHGFGKTLLEAAFPVLTGVPDAGGLEVYSVEAERTLVDADREPVGRLDVLVAGSRRANGASAAEKFVIAIEAKVDADEGEEQLARYERGIDTLVPQGTTRHLVFLTKHGHQAVTATRAWRAVSFEDVAIAFYGAYRRLDPLIPGYHILRYYLATIFRDMAGWQLPLSVKSPSPVLALYYLSRVGLQTGAEQ